MNSLNRPSADRDPEVASRYEALLRAWPDTPEETSLHAAYEFGRDMYARGMGVLDMIALHHRVLSGIITTGSPASIQALAETSGRVLMEALAPFEMTHRGFREANAALRASEERYRELFENANDIIFTTDLTGIITSINHAGLALSDYPRENAIGTNVDAIIAPEFLARAQAMRQTKLGAATMRTRYELEIVGRHGRRIPVEVSTRLIYHDGEPIGIQGIARDITDRRQAETAMRHLYQWLEEKAKRIAHALHDEAGQLLASVYLRVAEIAAEMPRASRQHLDSLRSLLDQVDEQIRRLAHELRPTLLDDLGLLPACEFLADGISRRSSVKVSVRGSTGGRLPPDVETALYRVTQEALTNAAKHARASMITVEFERVDNVFTGRLRDDGIGFDVASTMGRLGPHGLGLMGMRERLAALGGTLTIRSAAGEGTSIEFVVPLER